MRWRLSRRFFGNFQPVDDALPKFRDAGGAEKAVSWPLPRSAGGGRHTALHQAILTLDGAAHGIYRAAVAERPRRCASHPAAAHCYVGHDRIVSGYILPHRRRDQWRPCDNFASQHAGFAGTSSCLVAAFNGRGPRLSVCLRHSDLRAITK